MFDLKNLKNFEWVVFLASLLLFSLGIAIIYSATFGLFGDAREVIEQLIFGIIGIVLFFIISLFDYRVFKGISGILYVATLILLGSVYFFGSETLGATRWIKIGMFTFQPAEFAKLFMIIVMAKYFSDHAEEMHKFKNVIISGVYFLIPTLLVAFQPDLGTALVFVAIWGAMIIVSRIKIRYLFYLIFAALLLAPIGWFNLKDYQKNRITSFLNPESDLSGNGYNVSQAVIAVGSGQFMGRGLGHGSQSQLNFIPEKHTDFIFAALAEEMGLIGVSVVLFLYALLIIRITMIAARSRDYFGMYLATGALALLSFHVFLNIGMNIGIAPVAGIPLPLISLGGTAIVVIFILLGFLESIHMRHKKIDF